MIKVLALGHLPKWRGGRQTSGLATGIFDLHDSVNSLNADIEVIIAATDVFVTEKVFGNTKVLGWTKGILLKHLLKRVYRAPIFLMGAYKISKGKHLEDLSFTRVFLKLVFLDYSIEREKPNILHLHGNISALFKDYLWHKDLPVMLRLHGINGFNESLKCYEEHKQIEKSITKIRFNVVTFVTNSILNEWKDKYGSFGCDMFGVINGYNPDVFHVVSPMPDKEYDLITFSSISEGKGQLRVLEAMNKLKKDGISLKYLIIGGGDQGYIDKVKEYSKSNDLLVVIKDYCPQNEIPSLLAKAKYFILPSSKEGFGKVYVESVASGIPVILPENLPVVNEHIFNEKNALFIKDSTTESIYNVIKDLPEIQFTPNEIASTVSALSWKNIAKDYVNIYKKVVNDVQA